MTVVREADLHVPPGALDALGFGSLVDCFADGGVRDVGVLACGDASGTVVSTVAEPIDDALDAADTVEWWERLDRDGGGTTYLYEVVAPDRLETTSAWEDGDLAVLSVATEDRGVTLTIAGSQEALQRELDSYGAVDPPVTLRRLADFEGPQGALDRLTPRQREVVETAYDLGYYDVPREATADAIAGRLDLDRSTVTEHLQRAERTLLTRLLSGQ